MAQHQQAAPAPAQDDSRAVAYVKRLGQMQSARAVHEATWRECCAYSDPIKAEEFTASIPNAGTALNKQAKLTDSTLGDSSQSLAAAIVSGMTPASSQWLNYEVDGQTDEEKAYLENAATIVWSNIHASNYDAVAPECASDEVDIGWFVKFIDEDRERGGYHFEQWPAGQCYIAASKPGGTVDTVLRDYTLSAEQCVAEFGGAVSDKVRELAKTKPDAPVKLLRVIEPRKVYMPGAKLARNLPFSSVTLEQDGKRILKESGFHEFPCAVPRWKILKRSVYATGPVLTALPDARELNEWKRLFKTQGEWDLAPPLVATDDGVLNPKTITIGARRVIVANSVDNVKQLPSAGNWQLGVEMIADLKQSIRKTMMVTYLEPRDGPAVTATQVHVEVGLLRQLLGPVYGRLKSEWIKPMAERCFGLALRAGALGKPPDSLANRVLQVTYKDPFARAQKLEDVSAIERMNANIEQIAQFRPDVLDMVDTDEEVRVISEALGVPARIVRDERTVKMLREAKARDAQQQAQQQQAQGAQAAMTDAMARRVAQAA